MEEAAAAADMAAPGCLGGRVGRVGRLVTSTSISFSTEARLGGKNGSTSSLVFSGDGKY